MAHNTLPPPLELSEAAKKQISTATKPRPAPATVAPQTFNHLFTFEGGDTRVKVKYQDKEIFGSVVSHAMAMASPVWKKFIFPPWIPDAAATTKEIDFSGDNGEAVLLLLRIVHLKFTKVNTALSLDQLYEIALLCEQYDCHRLVQPWLKCWLEHVGVEKVKEVSLDHGGSFPHPRWLYIAWAFGRHELFSTLAKNTLVLGCAWSLLNPVCVVPERIFDSIRETRERALKQILDVSHDFLANFLQDCRNDYQCKEPLRTCDSSIYGSMIFELYQEDFWQTSLEKVYDDLYYVANAVTCIHKRIDILNEDHEQCRIPGFRAEVDAILQSLDPVLDCHRRHMDMRAAQLAFSEDSDIGAPDAKRRKTSKS